MRHDKCCRMRQGLTKYSARYKSDMRLLFAILGLVLYLIAACARELPVIKDSEAAQCWQYVGGAIRLSLSSLRPDQEWRMTSGSPRSKGKSSSPEELSPIAESLRPEPSQSVKLMKSKSVAKRAFCLAPDGDCSGVGLHCVFEIDTDGLTLWYCEERIQFQTHLSAPGDHFS
jgi:hypothetical protein